MTSFKDLDKAKLSELLFEYEAEYEFMKKKNLKLDLSRGKPDFDQLSLSDKMLDEVNSSSDFLTSDGIDVRNYGAMDGITEARSLVADIMGVKKENVIVGGNSSLNLMYDSLMRSMVFGVAGGEPFSLQMAKNKLKFICLVPGYDRHFAITEQLGFELISVPLGEDGPDMAKIEELVKDETVKGVWCVPKYSNPTGAVYSDETVRRFARLKPAAKDFRIYWDNAYAVHFIYPEKHREILNIISECEKAGNPDMVYEFFSTSKITYAGGGIAAVIASENNLKEIKSRMTYQTIGNDKVNQLRHVRFLKSADGVMELMKKQAEKVRPKFEAVLSTLDEELVGLGIAEYTRPVGGYFISFNALPGTAKEIVKMCKECGVKLTGAGATFPYGRDPEDKNIRLAPSYATVEDIRVAAKLFSVCVKIVSIKKLLDK